MEELKHVVLENELVGTFKKVKSQLLKDKQRWGDTWKKRGLIYNGKSQEIRAFERFIDYLDQFKNSNTPIPWEKVIGEAHICMVRDKYLKNDK